MEASNSRRVGCMGMKRAVYLTLIFSALSKSRKLLFGLSPLRRLSVIERQPRGMHTHTSERGWSDTRRAEPRRAREQWSENRKQDASTLRTYDAPALRRPAVTRSVWPSTDVSLPRLNLRPWRPTMLHIWRASLHPPHLRHHPHALRPVVPPTNSYRTDRTADNTRNPLHAPRSTTQYSIKRANECGRGGV